jgi:hypothetical protein
VVIQYTLFGKFKENQIFYITVDLGGEVNGGQPEECMGGPSGSA